MTARLLGSIERYLVDLDADLTDIETDVPIGSRAYSNESSSYFIWDGATWSALTPELAAVDLDAVLAQSSGQDIADALTLSASADATNVFATMADSPTADEKAALDGAASPDGTNVFVTLDDIAVLTAIPTVDPTDGVTIWNDSGVLKIASGP